MPAVDHEAFVDIPCWGRKQQEKVEVSIEVKRGPLRGAFASIPTV